MDSLSIDPTTVCKYSICSTLRAVLVCIYLCMMFDVCPVPLPIESWKSEVTGGIIELNTTVRPID